MEFIRSSYCDSSACLEVALNERDEIIVRNNNFPEFVILANKQEWEDFIRGVKDGEFDVESL